MNRLLAGLTTCLLMCSCASVWQPTPIEDVGFLSRAVVFEKRRIAVLAAVPSADEIVAIFGVDLYKRGVQPVWLEISNNSDDIFWFMPFGLDADYYTSLEVASMFRPGKAQAERDRYFLSTGVDPKVDAGTTRKGFVFTHVDEGTKIFNVDLIGAGASWRHTFFIPVPGLNIDHYDIDFDALYEADTFQNLSQDELIDYLAKSPCCVLNAKGTKMGDPLNIAVIGAPEDVYYSFVRAGWDETEGVNLSSGFKTAVSFTTGGEYRYSPVSNLYLFDRAQDVALQKARSNIHERNHLRLWMTPVRHENKPVWLGQISRDIGVRFARQTITTHKIDPDVDETREYLVENLAYSQVLEKIAYVEGVGEAPIDSPRKNLTGDPYFSDGLRVVAWISTDPVALDDIRMLDWTTTQ